MFTILLRKQKVSMADLGLARKGFHKIKEKKNYGIGQLRIKKCYAVALPCCTGSPHEHRKGNTTALRRHAKKARYKIKANLTNIAHKQNKTKAN